MLINGIELSSLGVKLYDRVITSNQVQTTQAWLDGDIQPTDIRQQDKFKSMTLKFLVLSTDEDDAYMRISRLTALLKKASIQFDDLKLMFDVSMTGTNKPERLKNGNFIVSYSFTCDYAKGEREIYTTNANMTNSFKLTVLYYQGSNVLLATDSITIRASSFNGVDDTLESIGIEVDKYLPEHYNHGVATNLGGFELNYVNLQNLKALIINYEPIAYNITVDYYLNDGAGYYNEILTRTVSFTYPQLSSATSIGQIIDAKSYKPDGYKAKIAYDGPLTVSELLKASPISIFYDKIANELSKNVIISYKKENDNGGFDEIYTEILNFKESQFVDGMTLGEIIPVGKYRPEGVYYNSGYYEGHNESELITYETLYTSYEIKYTRASNVIFVEYYAGVYPGWYRLTTANITTKYKDSYENNFDVIKDIGVDLNRYHTAPYEDGILYNGDVYTSYEEVINAGVLQVFYKPIDYTIKVHYYPEGPEGQIIEEEVVINDLMFLTNPILNDIIPITAHRPEGYQFSADLSYNGEVSLSALTQASPIQIVYTEIEELRTKNIIVRYKKELASAYSTINTSLITINEADVLDGIRLKDIINLNLYQPEYYEPGIVDGTSSTALITYDQLGSAYDVLYVASTYTAPVRYYTDDVDDLNWIGSATISFRIIDFEVSTTLFDLGLNLNLYKPAYCDDGVLQYTGPVNFSSLLEVESIDVMYETVEEPDDPDGIDYPHRFLFLQHNDLGEYEYLHPEWTLNHAFINTGVSANDMSKLTVIMECERVDNNVPLHDVNAGYAYLFGSSSGLGSFYMRFNNQTQYGVNLSGVNTYEARAGYNSNTLTLTEESAIGFSANSGIYSSAQEGYSRAIFTYSNNLQTDGAQMPYPLYLFANNKAGAYEGGLAGIGIYSCRIYYNDELIRDFIPVQFYDKIGDQVAPSNCLYDKVSKAFFEDGTGLNSFNIRDDDRYEDDNLEHKIGNCYVNYYKGDALFQTSTIWFRASDFVNGDWDLYEHFFVDQFQPAYHNPGIVDVDKDFVPTFEGLKNAIFNVYYEEQANQIIVNYYAEDADGNRTLLKEEHLPISEKDFYQVPTFGDIVRLNKYKPEGYETDFEYTGAKVSLARVLELSPYEIVYKPMTEAPVEYSTVIRYMKKVFGLRKYEVIGTEILTFDQSDFRDGEYIDFYIDFNKFKPDYYKDGEPYEWYRMDDNLLDPSILKSSYDVYYMPEPQYIDVNYYTDDIDEANMIASTTWMIQVDDWESKIQLPDTLPNEFINKYKPVGCSGGQILNPEVWYDFYDLIALGEISIWYETIVEPDDPTNLSYENKILYWGDLNPTAANDILDELRFIAGKIPYIDLGYRPKEIGRLRVEMVGTCMGLGYVDGSIENIQPGFYVSGNHASGSLGYTAFFGYQTPNPIWSNEEKHQYSNWLLNGDPVINAKYGFSTYSKGGFALFTRIPKVSSWVFTAEGPQSFDGITWYRGGDAVGVVGGNPITPYNGITAIFRRGMNYYYDDMYEPQPAFDTYWYSQLDSSEGKEWLTQTHRTGVMGEPLTEATKSNPWLGNPYYITLDAWNNYGELSTHEWTNYPYTHNWENTDNDFFEMREQPKGTLSLFQSTDPNTGKVNIMPFCPTHYPKISVVGTPNQLYQSALGNPYDGNWTTGITITQTVITGTDGQGNPIYQNKTTSKNINYARFPMPAAPQMKGCAVWSLKIYDRDRLVRDLIPVAKGDKIYDYVMPANGLFDKITEIFFGNGNEGGTYTFNGSFVNTEEGTISNAVATKTITANEVIPLQVMYDPLIYGKMTINYYDYDNTFINNQFVDVPTWYNAQNEDIEGYLHFNDYKPDDFHLDGIIDLDADLTFEAMSLLELYTMGLANVFYKLRSFTKTVVYYQDNCRIASKDLFYSLEDIEKAKTISDLGIDIDLYYDPNFAHGRIVFDENIIAEDNIQAFIDAPSPIVVYDKLSAEEAPNLLYVEYYRGGAADDELITINPDSTNYLDCNLDGVVLNPNGAIKYYNHYHSALYEDEKFDYFIPYQVRVVNKFAGIHRGPARRYPTLAMIVVEDTYTIIEERNGWGRLKEYPVGWILLSQTEPITGPGQNPDYDVADSEVATIPFGTHIHITQLTIDRLWCYVPEMESWVKAEDISYDQAGKLYNGLAIKVIDLENIDFSTVGSLMDMGINIDEYVLRFHDYSDYVYDGEYSYDAFSVLHNIEIVYPETIYNYTCVYYKDNKADANELGRAGFSCSISDWNPDWDIFIETSWQKDENGYPVNPKLYRDTDLSLTWDYFGFDRDLFRPDGYPNGIYLWNPRSWEKDNPSFSFEELIRTGSQFVVYPCFAPDTYKLWNSKNAIASYVIRYASGARPTTYVYNPPLYIDISTPNNSRFMEHYEQSELTSNETTATIHSIGEILPFQRITSPNGQTTVDNYITKVPGGRLSAWSSTEKYLEIGVSNTSNMGTGSKANQMTYYGKLLEEGMTIEFDLSEYTARYSPTHVIGIHNDYIGEPLTSYMRVSTTTGSPVQKIEYNTNLKHHNFTPKVDNTDAWNSSGTDYYYDRLALKKAPVSGLIKGIQSYENSMMYHYWVPVPKGLWYIYNGETLRIPANGLYDLLTGNFVRGYEYGDDLNDHGIKWYPNVPSDNHRIINTDGQNLIFLNNQRPDLNKGFYYFDDWFYNTTDVDYIIQVVQNTNTYDKPDKYSIDIRTLTPGLIMPVSKLTADADNKVVGEWYYSSGQWLNTEYTSIYAGEFDKLKLTPLQQSMSLLPGGDYTTFYVYLNPENVDTVGVSSSYSYGTASKPLTSYYYYINKNNEKFYFDGAYWVPEKYTSTYTTEHNKNYAIVNDTNYYSVPIANDEYKVGVYLYGERITVPYVATNNTNWAYTGRGWIELEGNTSEVL